MAADRRRYEPDDTVFVDADPVSVAYPGERSSNKPEPDVPLEESKPDVPVKKSKRKVTGEPLDWCRYTKIETMVCFAGLWELAEDLEERLQPLAPVRGPKRKHTVFEWCLMLVAADVNRSVRETARMFNSRKIWGWLREEVEAAWGDTAHSSRRLSDRGITRHQFHRFRERYLDDRMVEEIRYEVRAIMVEIAMFMGSFDPKAGSWIDPADTQTIMGDATWLKTAHTIDEPNEGNRSKHDKDARRYHKAENHKERFHHIEMTSTRQNKRHRRIILDCDMISPGTKEADVFYEQVEAIKALAPDLGVRVAGYDKVLDAETRDKLLDTGIVPLSKVNKSKGSDEHRSRNLGPHEFTLTNGNITKEVVVTVNGAPHLKVKGRNGRPDYVPLDLVDLQRNKNKETHTFYATHSVPVHHNVLPHMVGATTRIRQNSTKQEREAKPRHTRRSIAHRTFPEGSKQYNNLYGKREDTESSFSHYKSGLPNGRARTVGKGRIKLDLMGFQITTALTALVAYQQQTRADLSRWLGNHTPSPNYDPD